MISGMEESDVIVQEPEQGKAAQVNIPVFRSGGNTGVVAVHWQATLNGM